MTNTKAVIEYVDLTFKVQIAGSRFFGQANEKSDFDYFVAIDDITFINIVRKEFPELAISKLSKKYLDSSFVVVQVTCEDNIIHFITVRSFSEFKMMVTVQSLVKERWGGESFYKVPKSYRKIVFNWLKNNGATASEIEAVDIVINGFN